MTLRVRLLAILVGLVLAGGGALIATRAEGDGGDVGQRASDLGEIAKSNPFSPVVSGQPQLPRSIPGFESCLRPGPGCAFVELTLERYARIVGEDPDLYVHVETDVIPCPRPEGPEEGLGKPPCRELPENLTVVLYMRDEAARAFEERYGCGTPVLDPCR